MRIKSALRFAIYGVFAALFASGVIWLLADQLKDGSDSEIWQQIASYLLMLHGGAAMLTLMLFGALVPLHVQRAWRAGKNRVTGTASIAFNAVLVLSAFGLYYLGSEALRPWISGVHIAIGLAVPALIFMHVLVGRRGSAAANRDVRTPMPRPNLVTLVPSDSHARRELGGVDGLAVAPVPASAKVRAAR